MLVDKKTYWFIDSIAFWTAKFSTCMQSSNGCCEENSTCPDRYQCIDMASIADTCHGALTPLDCWTDDDCPQQQVMTCEGATLCSCIVACVSNPGVCRLAK